MERTPLSSERVVITGGTSGLGLALARLLHAEGARVGVVARTAERVAQVERELPGVVGVVADVAERDAIHRASLELLGALGGVDLLVHAASSLGPVPLRPLGDTECEDLERALVTNVIGPQRLTRALLGALEGSAREGRAPVVVNVSSDAAVSAYPGWGAYGASKAALLHLSAIWDAELGPVGVRVLSFDPGDMDTPLHAAAVPDADRSSLKRPEDSARELLSWVEAVRGRAS